MIGDNSLSALAAGIRAAHANVTASALQAAEQALEAGRLLNEARALIAHGSWAEWLKQHVGFSDRSARRYMQLARTGLKSATVAEIGLRGAIEALADSRGALPVPCPQLEIFASAAMNFNEPFAAVRETSPGLFGLVCLADASLVSLSKSIPFDWLERVVLTASDGRLRRDNWRWRRSDNDMFTFLSDLAKIENEHGKGAALDHAKRLARAEVDKAEAAVCEASEVRP